MFGLFRSTAHERTGHTLYAAAVAAARQPWFYERLGVPDTLDGRFDMIGLHTFLVIRRLQRAAKPGPAVAQAVFDAMFADMDQNLREMGVTDLGVGKRNKVMWEAFHGRAATYQPLLDDADLPGLASALARNVWRGDTPAAGAADSLARYAAAAGAALAAQPDPDLLAGRVAFPAGLVSA